MVHTMHNTINSKPFILNMFDTELVIFRLFWSISGGRCAFACEHQLTWRVETRCQLMFFRWNRSKPFAETVSCCFSPIRFVLTDSCDWSLQKITATHLVICHRLFQIREGGLCFHDPCVIHPYLFGCVPSVVSEHEIPQPFIHRMREKTQKENIKSKQKRKFKNGFCEIRYDTVIW